jgi:molybdopterin-dependent oxidoreductase alpha subunit
MSQNNAALTPSVLTGLIIRKADKKAVGVPAIASSVAHAWRYMKPSVALKTSLKMNQKGGFDCPGCAWPDPDDDRSVLGEYCENGMKAIAEEAQNKVIDKDFFQKHTVEALGKWSDFELGKSGRIGEPLILRGGKYAPISWENALELIAKELKTLDSPNEAIFYTSGRTSNEAAFLYQLFVRMYGTNNLPDCSNMCHESSGKALSATVGIGKGSVTLDDIHTSDLIIVIGQNPGTNHPRMLTALEKCKENGGKIIAINPLPEAGLLHYINPQNPLKILTGGTPLADMFLQVRINGDVALLKAIMVLLWEKEKAFQNTQNTEGGYFELKIKNSELKTPANPQLTTYNSQSPIPNPQPIFDWDFIKTQTEGFDEFISDLQNADFQQLVRDSDVSEALIREAADWVATHKNIVVCWAMGLTQHKNAVGNIQEIVNLLLLRGSIGRKGAGTCPVRGHSNVQGDRTMGIWEAAPPAFLDKLQTVFQFNPPRQNGFNTVEAIEAMHDGRGKVFFALGGNFLSATPDTHFTAEALRKCRLTVHVSTKLNRSHLVHGENALILPCLGRTEIDQQANGEQFVSCENSMGVVQSSRGILEPCSPHLKSEVAIVCELAKAVLGKNPVFDWDLLKNNYDLIRDLIEKTISGFDNFNEKVRQKSGFYLPNGARERQFKTPSGKAHFTINPAPTWQLQTGEYLMMTIRSHDQFNTTIYGLDDRYRGIFNERRVILMNEKDMNTEGVKMGDVVNLTSLYNNIRREAPRFVVVPFDIPQGNVATYFPEANPLVPISEFADKSFTPVSKSVVIKLEKAFF